MASLRNFPGSPYFFACYTDHNGLRRQRSTKQSNRKKAQAIADKLERAAKLGAESRLGEAQVRRILSEMHRDLHGEGIQSSSAKDFLTNWAATRAADTAPRTHQAYSQIVRDFLTSLGGRADADVSMITKSDVAKYRDSVLKRTSVGNANKSLKYLRVALGAAWKDGFIQENPAARLDTLKRKAGDRRERRAFTMGELKEVLGNAQGEWKGIILFGLYTGQRLKDIARLTWNAIDPEKQELRFVTGKTGRQMHIPIASPLMAYVRSMPAGDDPNAPLFPSAHAIAIKDTGDSRLSQQFHAILFAAGLAKERSKEETGNGRSLRREVSELSFHSLRHTATSLLKNAGVSEAVAMAIIGHSSAAMSRHYTHIEAASMRDALNRLPKL